MDTPPILRERYQEAVERIRELDQKGEMDIKGIDLVHVSGGNDAKWWMVATLPRNMFDLARARLEAEVNQILSRDNPDPATLHLQTDALLGY